MKQLRTAPTPRTDPPSPAEIYSSLVTVADHLKVFRDLTPRDLFAGLALIGICGTGDWDAPAAQKAFATADAMMKEREKKEIEEPEDSEREFVS